MTADRPLEGAPNARWFVGFLFLILVAHEGHELAHTVVGRVMCGAWGARDFNVWGLATGCETWVPTLIGPLFSWSVMWLGVYLLTRTEEATRWIGLACVFATNPLGRLLPALFGGGDEGVIARTLVGHPGPVARGLVVASALIFVVPPLVVAWRSLPVRRRLGWFALLFAAAILVTGPLLFVVGNRLLAARVLAERGPLGAPLLIELFTLVSVVGLGVTWRGLTNEP